MQSSNRKLLIVFEDSAQCVRIVVEITRLQFPVKISTRNQFHKIIADIAL